MFFSEFWFLLSDPRKRASERFWMQGKSLFLRTSIDAVYFGSHAMTLACGTAYLIKPTESNDPACGYLAMASGHLSHR